MVNPRNKQTPGVYLVEQDAASISVAQAPTALPVFLGYTESARNGDQDLTCIAMPIASMAEFVRYYGDPAGNEGAPAPRFQYASAASGTPPFASDAAGPRFNLYYSLMLFFNNGGGPCYIMSIGSYASAMASAPAQGDYGAAWSALARCPEPTMVLMPDAMLLSQADWISVSRQALVHCQAMQNRIAIVDIWQGYRPSNGAADDPIAGSGSGADGFYAIGSLGEAFNQFGVAYFPWINTDLVPASSIESSWFGAGSLATLQTDLIKEAASLFPASASGDLARQAYLQQLAGLAPASGRPAGANAKDTLHSLHRSIYAISPLYRQAIADLATSVNLLPPGGAMAGVYARNDNSAGVWQAPANTTILSALSPAVAITDSEQARINTPFNGLAVNPIRSFPQGGLLVWGARTMAGNSDDWRYVNVRRTMIMLEQSIKSALQAYQFQPNEQLTWVGVSSSIGAFLHAQWQCGALVGAKPADAYTVAVGLGSTMTGLDVMQGMMRVLVQVALVRPAEFIVLTFEQQMSAS